MYLYEKQHESGQIAVRIVLASRSENANPIVTYELEYPRFIHSELMTHRLFSRNAMSSRAVPVKKMIEQVRNNPAMPIHWGKNQKGMQADSEHNDVIKTLTTVNDESGNLKLKSKKYTREEAWKLAASGAAFWAERFDEAGYHKQIVNRMLEPFQRMKTIVTATEYDNFFWLRNHEDAQPEIREMAAIMLEGYKAVIPNKNLCKLLSSEQWHLPYIETKEDGSLWTWEGEEVSLATAKKISSSCCAQVSYRVLNTSQEKAVDIYARLVDAKPIHASPFEHIAKPIDYSDFRSGAVTHVDNEFQAWSGNLRGWVQFRQTIPESTNWDYLDFI